jgi:16S rRNA (guanine527-N7)-methyltransferase
MANNAYFEKRIPLVLELGFREEAIPVLKSYLELLWKTNDALNLISRKMTFEELIDNHLIDCLLPLKKFPTDVKSVADFGTGGGLPGVLYAIQFPKMKFYLFEKSHLKQGYLDLCKDIVPNIIVEGDLPLDLPEIDIVIARAFKPIDVMLKMSRNYYAKGGKYFLLKARKEKIEEEILEAKKEFKTLAPTIEQLTSPVLEVERHLVLI